MRPIMGWMIAMTALAVLSAGCRREPTKVAANKPVEPVKKAEPPKVDLPKDAPADEAKIKFQKTKEGIGRKFEMFDVQQVMTNLKVAHAKVFAEKNRGPTMEELFDACENNPKIVMMVKDGHIEMVWKSLRADDPANAALAYEFAPDNKGLRMVMTADYDIRPMQENEFLKLQKAPAKK